MNPYDFVPITWDRYPRRKEPLWHHRLTSINATSNSISSGRLEMQVEAEGPIFLPSPETNKQQGKRADPTKPRPFLHVKQSNQIVYILLGSSLKGMLRMLVETLGNGCLTLFDEEYEYKHIKEYIYKDYGEYIRNQFRRCFRNNDLCIACRIFGMMGRGKNAPVFLGKVNVSDAYSISVEPYAPQYTKALMNPKPHHDAFYLDQAQQYIAGRKYYFHHATPAFATGYIYISKEPINRFIQPLGPSSRFQFSVDFTCLEADEFAALLLALVLKPDMRHKIGYGKPMGLGSVYFSPTKLTLVDYAKRYTPQDEATSDDIETLEGPALDSYIHKHIASQESRFLTKQAMTDLGRIWKWPPSQNIKYQYPDQNWFDDHPTARIEQTP